MKKVREKFEQMIRVRTSLGLTQDEFAKILGVSENYVYLMESGTNKPGPKILEKLGLIEAESKLIAETPHPYRTKKESHIGSVRSAEIPGITTATDEAIQENADYFYTELVKPFGCQARPANIHTLLQYLIEMQERSIKYWAEKQKGKTP